jgi:hypothetical protein
VVAYLFGWIIWLTWQGHLAQRNTICKLGMTFAGYGEEITWNLKKKKKPKKGLLVSA